MLTSFIVLDVLILLQTLMIIGAAVVGIILMSRGIKTANAVKQSVFELLPKVNEILERVSEVVKMSEPVAGKAADIGSDIKDISGEFRRIVETARTSVDEVTGLVNDTSFRVKTQVERVDALVTENLNKLEQVSNRVAENLADPIAEISAVLRGGMAAARYFRRPKPGTDRGDGHDAGRL